MEKRNSNYSNVSHAFSWHINFYIFIWILYLYVNEKDFSKKV